MNATFIDESDAICYCLAFAKNLSYKVTRGCFRRKSLASALVFYYQKNLNFFAVQQDRCKVGASQADY